MSILTFTFRCLQRRQPALDFLWDFLGGIMPFEQCSGGLRANSGSRWADPY
jgi:hypothetical protein